MYIYFTMKRTLEQTWLGSAAAAPESFAVPRALYAEQRQQSNPAPLRSSSSSSSLDLNVLPISQQSTGSSLLEQTRNVRRRTSSAQTSPGIATSAYTTTLQDILTRFHVYTAAKAAGRNGASKDAISKLKNKVCNSKFLKEKHSCTLCLEDFNSGEKYTTLPCGHVFHTGSACKHNSSSCRGIIYWLQKHRTCPHCRYELESEIVVPHPSEQIIVPLLNRQFALIQAQSRLIDRQRREMQMFHQRLQEATRNQAQTQTETVKTETKTETDRINVSIPKAHVFPGDYHAPSTSTSTQWQDATLHHNERVDMLNKVTEIALHTLNWRIVNCSQSKLRKLSNLAAKVELNLYSEATSLETYQDYSTLKDRVLSKIRRLIWRAKVLKAQREEGLRLL